MVTMERNARVKRAVETIDRSDVQRLILSGLQDRPYAVYLLLNIRDPSRARSWLRYELDHSHIAIARQEGRSRQRELPYVLSIAFTWKGLCKLGLEGKVIENTFIPEFRQGMNAEARARALGDRNTSEWRWGKREDTEEDTVHLLCAVYVSDGKVRDDWSSWPRLCDLKTQHGLACVRCVRSQEQLPSGPTYEPFGFRDGISQPYIIGSDPAHASRFPLRDHIQPGEFVLGYRNEFGVLPATPHIYEAHKGDLPSIPLSNEGDLGKNGSFLVVRELEQNVDEFHKLPAQVAACMVGRWKDGKPLVWYPADMPLDLGDPQLPVQYGVDVTRPKDAAADAVCVHGDNDFTYYAHDMAGLRCPLGSHIRRSNPRDVRMDLTVGLTPEDSIRLSNQHRILRRGRPFVREGGQVGLFFMCLNTNIDRQFEFVQQSWLNSPEFIQPSGEVDPIAGARNGSAGDFTIRAGPRLEVRRGLSSYVTVRGGAYFFMPGIQALTYLSGLS